MDDGKLQQRLEQMEDSLAREEDARWAALVSACRLQPASFSVAIAIACRLVHQLTPNGPLYRQASADYRGPCLPGGLLFPGRDQLNV